MFSSLICAQVIFLGIFHSANAIFCSKAAAQGQFKHLVEIVYNGCGNPGICGGAILDGTHVLTAAHCVSKFKKKNLFIIAGTNDLRSTHGIKRKIEKMYIPEGYPLRECIGSLEYYTMKFLDWLLMEPMRPPHEHDIAVLKLDEALPLGEHISSVELPTSPTLPCYEAIPFASFGDIARNTSTTILKWANFHILDRRDCCERTGEDQRHKFCVIHPQELSCILHGDSGAPLVYNNIVIGVTSHGFASSDRPAIFTKVFDYLGFIKAALED